MENVIKSLEANLAEQTALVQILQSGSSVSSSTNHAYLPFSTNSPLTQATTFLRDSMHGRQLSHLVSTPMQATPANLSTHAKQLSTPVNVLKEKDLVRSLLGRSGDMLGAQTPQAIRMSAGLSVTQTDILKSMSDSLRTQTPGGEILRSRSPMTVDQLTGVSMSATSPGRRDSAPAGILAMTAAATSRNRYPSGATRQVLWCEFSLAVP